MTIRNKIIVATLLIAIVLLFPYSQFHGVKSVTLKFNIVDSSTLAPVENAKIQLLEWDPDTISVESRTSSEGVATITQKFSVSGSRSILISFYNVDYYPYYIVINAIGYESCVYSLSANEGGTSDPRRKLLKSHGSLNLSYPPPDSILIKIDPGN